MGATLNTLINFDKSKIHTWQHLDIPEENNMGVRLYFKPNGDNNGFNFFILEITCLEYLADAWDLEKTEVEVLFHGTAYFDGVRHLHFGHQSTDNEGYFFYPNFNLYKKCFDEIEKLEEQYCQDYIANK